MEAEIPVMELVEVQASEEEMEDLLESVEILVWELEEE